MSENVAAYYPNAICFADKSQISMNDNWFSEEYSNFWISLDACRNTTENPTKCKSTEEIQNFMESNIFYIISQKTTINKDTFLDTANEYFTEEKQIKYTGSDRYYTKKTYHPFEK